MESLLAVVDRLVETNEAIKSKLRESRDRIMEQASEIQSAEDLASTDALTQIGNRRRFHYELATSGPLHRCTLRRRRVCSDLW